MKEWIFDTINKNPNINIIVLTHHASSYVMLTNKDDPLSQCYASNLDEDIKKYDNIDYWLSGHTHLSKEIQIGSTTLMSNCMGYRDEKNIIGFDINKHLTFI